MSDRDLLELYSARILSLASSIPNVGRLSSPEGSARRRAPTCGSTLGAEVTMRDGRVTEHAQEVRACALGQAAAAVVGRAAVGRTLEEARAARDSLRTMLKAEGSPPAAPFDGFEVLVPARAHPNRHASILLAIEALVEAIEDAERKKAAATPGGAAAAQ